MSPHRRVRRSRRRSQARLEGLHGLSPALICSRRLSSALASPHEPAWAFIVSFGFAPTFPCLLYTSPSPRD
eukprot:1194096-Alexandrium_andersonii.AAC.1